MKPRRPCDRTNVGAWAQPNGAPTACEAPVFCSRRPMGGVRAAWLILTLRTAKRLQRTHPSATPGSPAVEPERTQPPLLSQFVPRGARRSGFRGRAEVIVNHHPAAVGEPVSITIDVPPN